MPVVIQVHTARAAAAINSTKNHGCVQEITQDEDAGLAYASHSLHIRSSVNAFAKGFIPSTGE
jgi:hypothetical protein